MNEKIKKILQKTSGNLKDFYKKHRQLSVSLCVLAAGLLLTVIMIVSRTKPAKVILPEITPLVKTVILEPGDFEMSIKGYGTIRAKTQVQIAPQVSGKIIAINPQFRAGGIIAAGEAILEIEPKDFELALQQAQAKVAEAQVKLDMEQSEASVALRQWQQLNPDTQPDSELVLRKPQIRQAQAALQSAQAAFAKADLDLQRTKITLPIDVRITSKNADLGQFVSASANLGSAYGMDIFEIQMPIEDRELKWFDLPSPAQVRAQFAGKEHIFAASAVRTAGQVDENSRMIYIVVEIKNPYTDANQADLLLPGIFAEVQINGKILKNGWQIKRDWLRNSKSLWLVKNGLLKIQDVAFVRSDEKYAYIEMPHQGKAEIITGMLDTPVDGMKIRTSPENK